MNNRSTYYEEVRKMARKGQVSVPAAIRDALGLKEGDKVTFTWQAQKRTR
jgi:AbrB family looped-hinge helix DNA binding protein